MFVDGIEYYDEPVLHLSEAVMESIAMRSGIPIYKLFPASYADRLFTVNEAREARDLAYSMGGRASKPNRDVAIVGPDGKTPILLLVDEGMEAAEAEDIALEHYERLEKRLARGSAIVPFDEIRARRHMPSRTAAPAAIAEAIEERIKRHKRNPITDPARQIDRARPNFFAFRHPEPRPILGEVI